jgi:hypothetical protein
MEAQLGSFDQPTFYDEDTEELYTWFERELQLREKEGLLSDKPKPRTKRYVVSGEQFVGTEEEKV